MIQASIRLEYLALGPSSGRSGAARRGSALRAAAETPVGKSAPGFDIIPDSELRLQFV